MLRGLGSGMTTIFRLKLAVSDFKKGEFRVRAKFIGKIK
jgi:hypothetical protein